MKKNGIKSILALILVLSMLLGCTGAAGETVSVQAAIDKDAAIELLTGAGVTEDTQAMAGAVIDLVNALGISVIKAENGAEIGLELNGSNALSLGWQADGEDVTLVSTLFPDYVLMMKKETIRQMLEQAQTYVPGFSAENDLGDSGDIDMNALQEAFGKYAAGFVQTCAAAAVPGDPVGGEYEFDGVGFDKMIPITVDAQAIREAFHSMTEEMLADEAVISIIQVSVPGQQINPEQIGKAVAEWEEHFPDKVTAEYYTCEDGSAFYIAGRAAYEGKEEPSYDYTMLMKDGKNGSLTVRCIDDGITISAVFGDQAIRIGFAKENGIDAALEMTSETDDQLSVFTCKLYLNSENPLLTAVVTLDQKGERTLPTEAGERIVVAIEDATENKEAVQGFQAEVLNNIQALGNTLMNAVPGMSEMMNRMMAPVETPAAEPEEVEEDEAGVFEGPLMGGWSAAEDPTVTDEIAALVEKGLYGLVGVGYEPVAYLGSQVVAGINHAVLCRGTVVAPNAEPFWVILYLYEDLEGNVSILRFDNLTLSAQDG